MPEKQVSTPDNGTIPNVETQDEPILTGTAAQLFPEYNEPAPLANEQGLVVKEGEPEPHESIHIDDGLLDTETFGKKKVKVKVDGAESEVSLSDLIRGYQTDQHLTRKGQKIGEEKRIIDGIIAELGLNKQPNVAVKPPEKPVDNDPLAEVIKPYIEPYLKEITDLKQTVKELSHVTQPQIYQKNLRELDVYLKKQGHSDFMEYVPRIEEKILNLPIEEQAEFNTPFAFAQLYTNMKIKDLEGKIKNPTSPDKPKEKTVVVTRVESGGGIPSTTGNDDIAAKDKELVDRAKQSGKIDDWMKVLSLRGV